MSRGFAVWQSDFVFVLPVHLRGERSAELWTNITVGRWRRRTKFTAELSSDEDKSNWRDMKVGALRRAEKDTAFCCRGYPHLH